MGSASIAPRAAPSASERSSESRLRLVRGFGFLRMESSFARPVFRSCGKGISQPLRCPAPGARRRAAARARRLGCPGSVLGYSIAQKLPALHGYRRRVFNGLDGRTARRVKPSHRPAGLISAVGRNVSKYVAGPPGSLAAVCRLIFGPEEPARAHAAKRLGRHTLYALLVTSGDQAF